MDNKSKICPRCKREYTGHPAISRKDNKTEICPECGTNEAMIAFEMFRMSYNTNINGREVKG